MKIWVDADACPVVIKEILYRAANRTETLTIFVANRLLRVPFSPFIKAQEVAKGFDVADNTIVQLLEIDDLVVTADIPLASEVISKQAHALNPRGEFYSVENIQERLTMRDLMDTLRASGIETNGPSTFNHGDRQAFAAQLDRFLARRNT
ncbi:MAG: YaiI/YqxD family protein [Methylophilus sp.]|nr:YaiI/YqxD family protein [Methylophilus sp.]